MKTIDAVRLKAWIQANLNPYDGSRSEYVLMRVLDEVESGRLDATSDTTPAVGVNADGLKSCPFCGGKAELDGRQAYRNLSSGQIENQSIVYCLKCTANISICHRDHRDISHDDLNFVVTEQWNTRTGGAGWIPDWLLEISQKLNTQDNRMTSEPLFCVFQKRRIYGIAEEYGEHSVWIQLDEGCEVDASEVELDEYEDPVNDIFEKVWYLDVDEFVTAHLTEAAALHHIKINGHNLKNPFTYVTSQYRCPEYIKLREWIMSLSKPPQAGGE